MNDILFYICIPFGYIMKWCWQLLGNYGLAIILFTLATKIVLMPLSVWIQKNSILMVKIQPEVNFLKARLQGNIDAIADGQAKIFKKAHYHPLLSIIPLVLQIILLLAVVEIIYHPFNYIFGCSSETINALAQYLGVDTSSSMYQLQIIDSVKNGVINSSTAVAGIEQAELLGILGKIDRFNIQFLGMNLSKVPSIVLGAYLLVPLFAGISSFVMCFTQNLSNVLQHEQSKWNQYGIMIISVALSLYLGLFVPSGIAVYWIASNLMSVGQMYLLNLVINPKKYVDYQALEESRKALAEAKAYGKQDKSDPKYKENKKREKADYRKFKNIANKHIVFYSERSGFYKYYKDIIAELLKRSNLVIHYVTNDPDDVIFEISKKEPRIKPYYIGLKKLVVLMMLLETDMFVMTTPDLDKYYLKRSHIKNDIEYVYVPHDSMSSFFGFKEGAFDAFNTIFCVGEHFKKEIQKTEEVYGLKPKNLVEFGFPIADYLAKMGAKTNEEREKRTGAIKEILIAPSWQEDNLLDSCIDKIIDGLYGDDCKLTVRPHPEYVKRYGFRLKELMERYKDRPQDKLVFETDFSANKSVYSSDVLITDWSGIGPEFAFATKRPALFINTKEKCENPNWEKIGMIPVEMSLRNELGVSLDKDKLDDIKNIVDDLLLNGDKYSEAITKRFDDFFYNHDCAGEKGAKYILRSLSKKNK